MSQSSGPLESITLGGRRFVCDSEDDVKIGLSGFKNEAKSNGDGSFRILKSREPGTISDANLQCDNDRGDHEYLQELRDALEPFDVSATEVDGTVYSGSACITDDLKFSTKNGTCGISLSGMFEKQG